MGNLLFDCTMSSRLASWSCDRHANCPLPASISGCVFVLGAFVLYAGLFPVCLIEIDGRLRDKNESDSSLRNYSMASVFRKSSCLIAFDIGPNLLSEVLLWQSGRGNMGCFASEGFAYCWSTTMERNAGHFSSQFHILERARRRWRGPVIR